MAWDPLTALGRTTPLFGFVGSWNMRRSRALTQLEAVRGTRSVRGPLPNEKNRDTSLSHGTASKTCDTVTFAQFVGEKDSI